MTNPGLLKLILFALGIAGVTIPCMDAQPQRRATIWHFGNSMGLDFSCGKPVALNNTHITSVEGATGICDESGNLLFYSNCGGGKRGTEEINGAIWNRNKEVIFDLNNTQGGGISASQGGIVVPDPASASRYYLFMVDELESIGSPARAHRGLTYFLIDMTLAGGYGGVVKSNMPVFLPAAEGITAARHSNGADYWVLTVDFESRDLVSVLVTANGVQAPVRHKRHVFVGPLVLKMSPDGQYLFDGTDLYRFDVSNGSIAWVCSIDLANNYSYSFSPSSRYLYTIRQTTPRTLVRYDLQDAVIGAEFEPVATLADYFTGYMQTGPDGNIYFNATNFSQGFDRVGVSAIQCPDTDAPKVLFDVLYFFVNAQGSQNGRFAGLVNIADFWFDDLQDEIEGDTLEKKLCPGTTLTLRPGCKGESYRWSTGATGEVLPVTEPGQYRVSITSGCFTVVETHLVVPGQQPAVAMEYAPFDNFCAALPFPLQAVAQHADTLVWSTGATGPGIAVEYGGRYSVTAANACGEAEAVVEFPTDLCCHVFVPNAFAPDRFGFNEQFQIAPFQCPFTEFQLRVYSRWGEPTFESNDPNVFWNGISRGQKWPAGVYLWTMTYRLSNDPKQRLIRRHGDLTLLR